MAFVNSYPDLKTRKDSRSNLLRISIKRNTIVSGVLFILVLTFSLTTYFVFNDLKRRRVLFFPELKSLKLSGEVRYLPKRNDMESEIELLLKELILGPSREDHLMLVSRNVKLLSMIVKNREVFVNFSSDILFEVAQNRLGLNETFSAIADSIIFNFPTIRRVYFFIEGQIPKGTDYVKGLGYDNKILK